MFQDHRRSEGRSSSTGNLSEAVVHRERDVKDSADTTFQGICATTTCFHWHPTESGCRFGDNCLFNHALAANQPSKKNEGMWWRRISCVAEDFHTIKQGSSRFGTAEIQVITEGLKNFGTETQRNILQRCITPHDNSGKKSILSKKRVLQHFGQKIVVT